MTKHIKLPRNEQETIISYDNATGQWYFYSDCPKHCRKWEALVSDPIRKEIYPDGTEKVLEGPITGTVMIKKPLSEEQRKEAAARLRKLTDGSE